MELLSNDILLNRAGSLTTSLISLPGYAVFVSKKNPSVILVQRLYTSGYPMHSRLWTFASGLFRRGALRWVSYINIDAWRSLPNSLIRFFLSTINPKVIMELCNKLFAYARLIFSPIAWLKHILIRITTNGRSDTERDKILAIEKLALFFGRRDVISSIPSFGNAEWQAGILELTSIICKNSPTDLPATLREIDGCSRVRLIDIIFFTCRGPLLWPKREWTLLHSVPGQFWEDPRDIYYVPSDLEKKEAWANAFRTFLILLRW